MNCNIIFIVLELLESHLLSKAKLTILQRELHSAMLNEFFFLV